jgi:hypothetical protein
MSVSFPKWECTGNMQSNCMCCIHIVVFCGVTLWGVVSGNVSIQHSASQEAGENVTVKRTTISLLTGVQTKNLAFVMYVISPSQIIHKLN